MRRGLYILLIFMSVLQITPAGAQGDRKDVRRGNRDFRKENFREAEIDYRKALVKDSLSVAANYNLASVLYRQKDMDQAAKVLERIKDVAPAAESAADYYFNRGDVAIAQQDWQGAVDAFRESLLRNPGDLDAKENYIYARKKLEEQQQNQQQNQNDQNQDQQNNNQNQDNQNNQNNQNNPNNQDDKQNQQGQQPPRSGMSEQQQQQLLNAIQAQEDKTQEKLDEKAKGVIIKGRKNW